MQHIHKGGFGLLQQHWQGDTSAAFNLFVKGYWDFEILWKKIPPLFLLCTLDPEMTEAPDVADCRLSCEKEQELSHSPGSGLFYWNGSCWHLPAQHLSTLDCPWETPRNPMQLNQSRLPSCAKVPTLWDLCGSAYKANWDLTPWDLFTGGYHSVSPLYPELMP